MAMGLGQAECGSVVRQVHWDVQLNVTLFVAHRSEDFLSRPRGLVGLVRVLMLGLALVLVFGCEALEHIHIW
jgi:hypothetical protein